MYRVYTYSRDLENGLCDRHKKAEVVRLSEFQKKEPTSSLNGSYKGNKRRINISLDDYILSFADIVGEEDSPHLLPLPVTNSLVTGSYPGHLNRPCLLHNGHVVTPTLPSSSCPAHGPSLTSTASLSHHHNGAIPNNAPPNKFSFSPERVI